MVDFTLRCNSYVFASFFLWCISIALPGNCTNKYYIQHILWIYDPDSSMYTAVRVDEALATSKKHHKKAPGAKRAYTTLCHIVDFRKSLVDEVSIAAFSQWSPFTCNTFKSCSSFSTTMMLALQFSAMKWMASGLLVV